MATTKNALLRYQVLDRCFRNHARKYFWQDLLEECNKALYEYNGENSSINKRQLYDDMKFMESDQGWSIDLRKIRDGRRIYYRYLDSKFSINNQPLTEEEISQLQSALTVLSKFRGLPQFNWMEEILPRLHTGIDPKSIAPVFHFDENPFLKGKELIGTLFNFILYNTVVDIEYKDYNAEKPYTLTIHPYLLKEFNNRWFLFGRNEFNKVDSWNLAIDRIIKVEANHAIEFKKSSTDWEEYFEDLIGVTRLADTSLTKIVLEFDKTTAPYILSKPFHGSQKTKSFDEKGLIIEIEIYPNYEFYQKVLSYGDAVKILSPELIVNQVKEKLEKSIRNYISK